MKNVLAVVKSETGLVEANAPNARVAQDKIYVWERQDKTVIEDPDPASFFPPAEPGKPRLGVRAADVPPIVAAACHLADANGALILFVQKGSVAEAAGLMPEDIVLSYAGRPLANASELVNLVGGARPGAVVPIDIVRGEQRRTMTARF